MISDSRDDEAFYAFLSVCSKSLRPRACHATLHTGISAYSK